MRVRGVTRGAAIVLFLWSAWPASAERVQFVGCAADGQTGAVAAPNAGQTPDLPSAVARRLAYYKSNDLGVLAPRGWHCFGDYGSSGAFLIVAPRPIPFGPLTRSSGAGPRVEVSVRHGGTSGRFAVADAIARYFPAYLDFASTVVAMGFDMAPLPSGPYPADRITRLSAAAISFYTPPNRSGEGTGGVIPHHEFGTTGAIVLSGPDDEPDLHRILVRGVASEPVAAIIGEFLSQAGFLSD